MKILNLKLQGGIEINPIIAIDGKLIQYKRNKYKTALIKYETEKDYVDVEISNILEIKGPYWWFVQMFFYIISLFGILNPRLEKFCYLVNYKSRIYLTNNENDVIIKFNLFKENSRAIEIKTQCNVEENVNEYLLDLEAKKRKKILKISHILSWITLIATIIIILIV